MATQFVHDDRNVKTSRTAGAGSIFELIAAAAAAVLCIIGLAGGASVWLDAIATIIIGAALLVEGGGVVTRHRRYFSEGETSSSSSRGTDAGQAVEVGRTSAESIAGIAGIVLGILSVIGLAPDVLIPISVIVFGGGLLMGMGAGVRGGMSGTGHALIGCGAVVLGILSLVQVAPTTLSLCGLLAVSAALFMSSFSMGTHAWTHHGGPMHHAHG